MIADTAVLADTRASSHQNNPALDTGSRPHSEGKLTSRRATSGGFFLANGMNRSDIIKRRAFGHDFLVIRTVAFDGFLPFAILLA
jgi:hypothetical protein